MNVEKSLLYSPGDHLNFQVMSLVPFTTFARSTFIGGRIGGHLIRLMSTARKRDVVVIGGGPGGYIAAIKAAQLGLKVACVESRGALGGTCLNVGCIPSKTLLHYTHVLHEGEKAMKNLCTPEVSKSVKVASRGVDIRKLMKTKNTAIRTLTHGIDGLFKKNGVEYLKGHGRITGPNTVHVNSVDITTSNIVVATGSEPISLPGIDIDEKSIVTSTGALSMEKIPDRMIVIGAGVIGLELGSVWSRLGSKVSFVEYAKQIGGYMDGDMSSLLRRSLEKQGMIFHCGEKVVSASRKGKSIIVATETDNGIVEHEGDAVLVAVGRKPYTKGLGLDNIGVMMDKRGKVNIDNKYRTNIPSIYAIGDVVRGPMLAHKAEEEGVAVAEIIAGHSPAELDFDTIPGVVYTSPELAFVGLLEEQCKDYDYSVGKYPIAANSRARATGESEGVVKVITDNHTGKLLGLHIMCNNASEMIGEAVLAVTNTMKSKDIAHSCHAHPTVSEAVKEAALASFGLPLNL